MRKRTHDLPDEKIAMAGINSSKSVKNLIRNRTTNFYRQKRKKTADGVVANFFLLLFI